MKKFEEFLWELVGKPLTYLLIGILMIALFVLGVTWIFTGFGLIVFYDTEGLPTPLWVRWFIGIFDIIVLLWIIIDAITTAYKKVYKN
jgi:cytochrome c biogenesis protein CcdA